MIIDGTRREDEEEGQRIGGGSQTLTSGGTSSGNVSQSTPTPTSSGRYTNLNQYINKNRGATNQTLNKAQSDLSNTEGQTQSIRGRISDIANTGERDYGAVKRTQDYQRSVANNPYSLDPNSFFGNTSASRDRINQAQTEQGNLQNLRGQKEALSNLTTTGGIRNYLDSIRGNRAGSAGGRELDTFLLSSTPESGQAIQDISKRAGALNLDASPELSRLESAYQSTTGYDPNATIAQIVNRADNDLDTKNFDSVSRYNRLQEMLGRTNRAQFQAPVIYGGDLPTTQDVINATSSTVPAIATDVPRPTTTTTQTSTPQTGSGNAVPAGRPGTGQAPGGSATMGGARPSQSQYIYQNGQRVPNPNYRPASNQSTGRR